MLRIPHCLDKQLTDGGKVVSPTHRPHFTPRNIIVSFLVLNLPNPSGSTRPWSSLSLYQKCVLETLKKIMTLGSKVRLVRRADKLTAVWADCLDQCFSTAGPRPSSGPWHQLYWAARGSSGICHFYFLSTHRIHKCTNTLYDYAIINY
jgi:hypothetical protein